MSERVWIKICGLTSETGVAAAIDAQVDAIGFVFAPSTRRVTPQRAAELARAVPVSIARVAVFLHPDQALLDAVCDVLRPDIVQTDIEDLAALRVPSSVSVNPVLRAGRPPSVQLPPRILFEGPASGVGQRADWAEASALARRTQLILAGGLRPETVADAIRSVRPYGVDVSSGVESAPGVKAPRLIQEFVQAARGTVPARGLSPFPETAE